MSEDMALHVTTTVTHEATTPNQWRVVPLDVPSFTFTGVPVKETVYMPDVPWSPVDLFVWE